jgi:prepilin-type N-terminal cleavage/methylation domain-containing protein
MTDDSRTLLLNYPKVSVAYSKACWIVVKCLCIVMTMRKNQQGFSLIEVLLVIILLAAIASTGLYVYNRKTNARKVNSNQQTASAINSENPVKVSSATPTSTPTNNLQLGNAKSIQISSAINTKRIANNRPVLVYKDDLQNIAVSVANAVTELQSNSPTTKLTIEMLDEFYAKAGGNKDTMIYTTLIGIGCQTGAATMADQMYEHQDSYLRNPRYTKVGIAISTLDWGCSIIAVLAE